jgi:hypothetical protein
MHGISNYHMIPNIPHTKMRQEVISSLNSGCHWTASGPESASATARGGRAWLHRDSVAAALDASPRWMPDADSPASQTCRPPSDASLLSASLLLCLLCWCLRCFGMEFLHDVPSSPTAGSKRHAGTPRTPAHPQRELPELAAQSVCRPRNLTCLYSR